MSCAKCSRSLGLWPPRNWAFSSNTIGKRRHHILATKSLTLPSHSHLAPLHEEWRAAGRTTPELSCPSNSAVAKYGLLLNRMLRLLDHFTANEIVNNLAHLEQFK